MGEKVNHQQRNEDKEVSNPFPILRQRDANARLAWHTTPVIKGQLTKAHKVHSHEDGSLYRRVREIFSKTLPPEQAKHAAKLYVAMDLL
jgi:nitrous oxide reductase accessory protein NosL